MGREGICRVEEKEGEGLFIAWIDNSPEALRRQEAIKKKERQDKGDEEREQKLIRDQIERAETAMAKARQGEDNEANELKREEGATIKLNFGIQPKESKEAWSTDSLNDEDVNGLKKEHKESMSSPTGIPTPPPTEVSPPPPQRTSSKLGMIDKPKNVFARLPKKNTPSTKVAFKEVPKKAMSETERIMREELERKRIRGGNGGPGLNVKRPRLE